MQRTAHPQRPETSPRTVALGAFAGTALEWYDYYIYGTAAALVFDGQFFPELSPFAGTMASFATFGVGFVARPLGAAVFGHLGDRYGRRRILMVTVVLIGAVTGCIGLLPTYAQIGVAAPILLATLRLLQGISVGGEWSGAATLAIEHAPKEKRGIYGVMPQMGSPVGSLTATAVFALVSTLPDAQFDSWGWRVPFLLGFPLLLVALWVRSRVDESPVFREMMTQQRAAKRPLVELVRTSGRRLVVGIAVSFVGIGGYYLCGTYLVNYGSDTAGIDRTALLNAATLASFINLCLYPLFGRIADRVGPGPVAVWGAAASAVAAFPIFWLVGLGSTVGVAAGLIAGVVLVSISYAACGQLLSEMFTSEVRYSGVGLSYNVSGAISGFVPLAATALLAATGQNLWAIAVMLCVFSLITLFAAVAAKRLRVVEL
ncbi:MFS transporter [Nonomuraea jiangxiensis]|uniref:Putative proline/betaine transporter n=1 Tax=Nonomuraea jiangxiensis TaxID=633440 RepID=A0A1G9H855_9ACTN|nr:MFS transporter [Nonomuraea jiangxiensis]SDL09168.1 Predicted arabinose efflux permease, MFS family [Nonomuraea jiangxiensis]